MTNSHSDRFRISLPTLERGYLHWLAVESGNSEAREASLLLMTGIRLAMRRYQRLYGGLPMDPADQATLEQNTPRAPGDTKPKEYNRRPEHAPVGSFDVDPGDPPLTLPDWAGGHDFNPHREKRFGGHGEGEPK